MATENLKQKIEAILFYIAEPVSFDYLAKVLEVSIEDVQNAVQEISEESKDRGVRVVVHDDSAVFVTASEFSDTIEKIVKEERERDLGRASLETLSIVAYKGPISKKEIEYIRGVNSQFALRSLLLRGLVERKNSDRDERVMLYSITHDALLHLGLGSITELPEYEATRATLNIVPEEEEQEYGE